MHSFKIEMTGVNRGKVWIDDKPLEGVKAVSFSADVDSLTEVRLTLHAASISAASEYVDVTCIESKAPGFAQAVAP